MCNVLLILEDQFSQPETWKVQNLTMEKV
jgi:hypothetical protein